MSKMNTPSLAQWKRLYKVAVELKKMRPWQVFVDTDIFTLAHPAHPALIYTNILGNEGVCEGILAYPGEHAFAGLDCIFRAPEDTPLAVRLRWQEAIACYYGDRDELTADERAVIKSLGLHFHGRGEWPYFRAMEPGLAPWMPTAEQAELMADALEGLIMSLAHLASGKIEVDFDAGETLLRFPAEGEEGMWHSRALPLSEIPHRINQYEVRDDLLVARMKKAPQRPVAIEVDYACLPVRINAGRKTRPVLPNVILFVEADTGIIIFNHMVGSDESLVNALLSNLASLVIEQGRPEAVHVRDGIVAGMVANLLGQAGIPLHVSEDLRLDGIDDALDGLMEFMAEDGE